MLKFALFVSITTCYIIFSAESIKVDSDFLDSILENQNAKLPCSDQIDRFIDVKVEKQDSQVYDNSIITLRGLLKNGGFRNISLFASEVANDGFRRTLVLETGIFDKLYSVYTKVVSEMRALMNAVHDKSEPLFLELIDAKNGSYVITKIPGRGWALGADGMDINKADMGLALRSLAKWHAMSAVLIEKGQINRENFNERLSTHRVNQYYTALLDKLANAIQTSWGKKWRQFAQQLKHTVPTVDQKLREIFNHTNKDSFEVLNLGDFHWPNTWCNFGITDAFVTDHPIAIKFTSFEAAHINTPAFDIHNVIYTSPNTHMALRYKDGLIRNVYYPALIGYLSKFKYEGRKPTLRRLEEDLLRSELYGVIISINFFSDDVFGENEDAGRVDMIEESWRAGEIKSNMTGMLKKGFYNAIKPVMEHAKDRHIFGRRDMGAGEKSRSTSDSDSDSD